MIKTPYQYIPKVAWLFYVQNMRYFEMTFNLCKRKIFCINGKILLNKYINQSFKSHG